MLTPPLHVCSFESRRRDEMARFIERAGGVATIAPSMKEVPLSDHVAAFTFAERLNSGEIDVVLFMTGVGTDALFDALETRSLVEPVFQALSRRTVIARGPKPVAALSRKGVRVDWKAPEPNTWREVLGVLHESGIPLAGKTIAIQEYGEPSTELYESLSDAGMSVVTVPVYKWALPDNLEPLRGAIRTTIEGGFDVLLWTSAQQVNHVLQTAAAMGVESPWREAARECVIGSIGPTASERLASMGLAPDLEPSHPKMAHLVRETLAAAREILKRKRGSGP